MPTSPHTLDRHIAPATAIAAKHTPGPWAFCNHTLCQANGKFLHLGEWRESSGLGSAAAANMRLIETAPDLLAALTDAEFLLRKAGQIAGPMQDSFKRSAEDARAAIARATEEQS